MGDLLSFLYTVVDSLSLILFLDVFAERRWSDRKFVIGVVGFIMLNFWILKVPLIFFHRNQAIKIGMILLSYTFSARVLYAKISSKLLLLLVGVEYLITYSLSFGLGMLWAFICGMDGESFRSSFPLMIVYGVINYSTELFLAYLFRKLMKQKAFPGARNRLNESQLGFYFLFPCTSFFPAGDPAVYTTGKPVGEGVIAFTCGLILAAELLSCTSWIGWNEPSKPRKIFWRWGSSSSSRPKIWKRRADFMQNSVTRSTISEHISTQFKAFC